MNVFEDQSKLKLYNNLGYLIVIYILSCYFFDDLSLVQLSISNLSISTEKLVNYFELDWKIL